MSVRAQVAERHQEITIISFIQGRENVPLKDTNLYPDSERSSTGARISNAGFSDLIVGIQPE